MGTGGGSVEVLLLSRGAVVGWVVGWGGRRGVGLCGLGRVGGGWGWGFGDGGLGIGGGVGGIKLGVVLCCVVLGCAGLREDGMAGAGAGPGWGGSRIFRR